MSRFRPTTLAAAIAALASIQANAQNHLELDNVVVTAAGYAQSVQDAPASISVITREELQTGAYRDITDALRSVPGVIVTGGGAGDNGVDVSMRGMPAQYTLLLVDGRRQGSRESRPNGSAGFEQDWLPPLMAIERIEVIRGPMSTLYGSDAIGGVINIITRKVAEEWHGNVRLESTIQESSDSGNAHQSQIYVAGPLVPNLLGLHVYGQYNTRQEDDIINGYESRDFENLTARLTLTPLDNHDFAFEAGHQNTQRESHAGRSADEYSFNEHEREYAALTHNGRWGVATSTSYVQRESTINKERDIEITNTVANTNWVVPLGNHIVTAGANYIYEELDDSTTNRISDRTYVDHSQYSLFAENEWLMTDAFALTAGLRLDDDDNYGSHLSPRLYGVWNVAPMWTLKGGVSTGYRSPSLREITADWGATSRGGNIYGNPDLEPETSVNKELALLYHAPRGIDASLTVFHNDFKDKITRVACPIDICTAGPNQFGSDPTYRINVDEAVTQGAEVSLTAPLTNTLTFTSSYTYTDSEQKSGEYAGRPLTQLPKHQVVGKFDWRPNTRLNAWTSVTYRGEESQPITAPSSSTLVAPSYTIVDSGGAWRLTDSTQLLFGVYNLLDEDVNYDEYGYVEDGRRYWVGLNIDF
ncbi:MULTISPECIES: ligand-gated channel protein [Halomonadaceae]|uniref:ligand-gated channel protein n=1 Tax=Halomonadaceae TaxID=28256 RepID=UPI00200DAD00|nr:MULTISPECIES: ligand-gated channel protein [unclassified Halomonas]